MRGSTDKLDAARRTVAETEDVGEYFRLIHTEDAIKYFRSAEYHR